MVEVFLNAREAGDVDGALPVVAPDIVMRATNELEYRGADQLRQWLVSTGQDLAVPEFQLQFACWTAGKSRSWWRQKIWLWAIS